MTSRKSSGARLVTRCAPGPCSSNTSLASAAGRLASPVQEVGLQEEVAPQDVELHAQEQVQQGH